MAQSKLLADGVRCCWLPTGDPGVWRVDTKRRLLRVTVHCWVPTRTTYARESKLALRPKLSRIPRLSALTMPSDMRWEWCDLKEKTLRRVLYVARAVGA